MLALLLRRQRLEQPGLRGTVATVEKQTREEMVGQTVAWVRRSHGQAKKVDANHHSRFRAFSSV